MSDKPLIYDVFCGAGGAGRGYQEAGFFVVGIDNRPQPRYAGDDFIQMDAFDFFDAVERGEYPQPDCWHASPPCQRYARTRHLHQAKGAQHPDLVDPTRRRLTQSGRPYIIENVVGSPLIDPIVLCGTMFGLKVFRHRLFETSFMVLAPAHVRHQGAANSHRRPKGFRNANTGKSYPMGDFITVAGHNFEMVTASAAMGIDWMGVRRELAQAIPPAYTRFVGEQAIRIIGKEQAA